MQGETEKNLNPKWVKIAHRRRPETPTDSP